MSKKDKAKTHTESTESKKKNTGNVKRYLRQALGVIGIGVTISMYVQFMPLMFAMLGGYIGVPYDATLNQVDMTVWILTSVSIMVPLMVGLIYWLKFLWVRLVRGQKSKTKTSK